ncbi:MAG: ATP-binding protein [Oscillospiraceae bacterium]|nr:ATP-binding protein [Oscillospiraceae bacterium]
MSIAIIVTGCPASGKTTFAQMLSNELDIPCFSKDLIKIALSEYIPISNQEESSRLSKATVNAMFSVAESLMAVNAPFILEANFRQYEGNRINELLAKYNYRCLTYLFGGDLKILGKRFVERDKTDERRNANKMFDLVEDYDLYPELFKEFVGITIGENTVNVDATTFENIDFAYLIRLADAELSN